MSQDVLDFVTYKERLKAAEFEMVFANLNYEENSGSSEWGPHYWQKFEEARNHYRAVRDEVPQDERD
jgi:hypothetical protein